MNSKVRDVPHITKEEAISVMTLAKIQHTQVHALENEYWQHQYMGDTYRPYWMFMTDIGPIVIGHRKRVYEINWNGTPVRGKVTSDENVTSEDRYVHAWSMLKLMEYATALSANIDAYKAEKLGKEKGETS